jgi:two-component system, OmpR family, response regulator
LNARILICDDEPKLVALFGIFLRKENFITETASNGKECLEKVKSFRPALLILDVMMPELDGLAVCREIRKSSNLPIIMATARDAESDRRRGLEAGANDYLVKPFSPRELVKRVKIILEQSS